MMPLPPRIGQLRKVITIQRQRKVSDGMGNFNGTWAPLISGIRARITPLKGTEEVLAARLTGVGQYNVVVRLSSETAAITASDRIVDAAGTVYNIRFVSNFDEKSRFLTLLAETGVAT